jgi:pilus assembly protein FimV
VRNLTKALTVVSLLAPVSGYSLGIGDIRVRSALNQNLSAEISLVAAHGENPSNIKVSLAPPEKFDEAGVPWSYFLSKIKFQPIVKPNGSMVIKVTSREALKEPFLNFLLEVSWPKGNLYREFTVLVDPPAEYQAPTYQEPAYPQTSGYENNPPQQEDYVPRHRPARHTARPQRSSSGGRSGQIVTRRNDTLWNVAERTRGGDVSVEQMMIALYEKNPHAFYQQNVNALSAGKRLQIPEKSVVQQTSRQEALAEFGRQNDAWNNNRSGIPSGESQLAKEDAVDSQLKLEAPTEATVGQNEAVSPSSEQASGTKSVATPNGQQQAATDKESTKATSAPVDEALQSKVAALEKQMAMMQELIALKDKQLAELQNPAEATTPATQTPPTQITPPAPAITKPGQLTPPVPVTPEQPIQTVPTLVKPVQPVVAPKPIVKPPVKQVVQPEPIAEEPSLFLLWLLGGIGAILLSLFGWLWWRKQQVAKETDSESMFGSYSTVRNSNLTSIRKTGAAAGAQSGESSFLNEFKASDFESFESFNVDHGDIDPIAEADVYLAYGRYQQAEDLIRQAIKDFPGRDECKLKLLEIFHANASKEAFESYATELATAGKKDDKDFWGKVIELGKDICPDSELFTSPSPSNVAVFATESDELTENVLFNSVAGQDANINLVDETEHLGTATFDVSDIDAEESLFDAPHQEPSIQHQDEPIVEIEENQGNESDFGLDSFEDKLGGPQDNETIDFDLDPYPEPTQKVESEKPSLSSAVTLDDKGEFEAYEFDFNPDKTNSKESKKPAKTEAVQAIDTWNPDQTIDFAMDDLPETDTFGNDTIDFSFDLDEPLSGSDKQSNQDQGFMVSDLTDMDEMETKLDLAKAYIDMGDADSAKEIIEQVLEKGSADQKKTAQMLLDDLSLE